jgi:hypothetical protein
MSSLRTLTSHLVEEGNAALASPRHFVEFTGDTAADTLLNDIANYPQAFVLACLCDRRGSAQRAWKVPYELRQRLGTLAVAELNDLSDIDWLRVVNIQALGLQLRWVITGYVSAAGAVLMSWLCVVSGMIAGCVRCAAGAFRGSA